MTVSSESKVAGNWVSSASSLHFLQSFELVILAASVENSKKLFSSQLDRCGGRTNSSVHRTLLVSANLAFFALRDQPHAPC